MQAAKVMAARRGEPLKDLFTRAVAHEVGKSTRPGTGGARLALPLIGSDEEPKAEVTNADIEAAFGAEEIERYGQ
jgi:hypothetical protein